MSALFLLNLFRLFGITEMFCSFVGRKQITVRGFAFVAPCRIFKLKTDADGAMTQNPC